MGKKVVYTKENPQDVKKEVNSVTPRKFADIEEIVKKLKRKEGVIIDFERVSPRVAQRMLDFISGVVFVMNGSIKKIKNKMYIIIPDGIKISTVRER